MRTPSFKREQGLSLTETILGVAILLLLAVSIFQAYVNLVDLMANARTKIAATTLANELFEVVRNLPYEDVGIEGAIPDGILLRATTHDRANRTFHATTTVRNFDDPFDGLAGGTPNDLSPADSKLVEIEIGCPSCENFSPLFFTTRVAPKNLETASTNGALFVQVIDASGLPVENAEVRIENNITIPNILIEDVTNNQGMLQVIDAPPENEAYEIFVSNEGYTNAQTYDSVDLGGSTPMQQHATVILQSVTQNTFIIDQAATINVSTVSQICSPVGSVDFSLTGSKLIGTSPDYLKYDQVHVTDGSGDITLGSIEWDTYDLVITDPTYQLNGSDPSVLLDVAPGEDQDVTLIIGPRDPSSLLVTVRDATTLQPVAGAEVVLEDSGSNEVQLITGEGFLSQTDWSGGSGQDEFIDETEYSTGDDIDTTTNPGEILLQDLLGVYENDGTLTSSIFDTGGSSNFGQLTWLPGSQPAQTGADSVRFQFASANATTGPWTFLGPDGTAGTYYTTAETDIAGIHDADQYARYKVYLQTADTSVTPNISDASFTFTTGCIPPGQVVFTGMSQEDYILRVTAPGYQQHEEPFTIDQDWENYEVLLNTL